MPIASGPATSLGAWVLPSVVIVGSIAVASRTPLHEPWMFGLLGSVIAVAVATVVIDRRESVAGKWIVAMAILGLFELVMLARLGGASRLASAWPLRGPIAASFALVGVCLLGLASRKPWARALAVGLGIACVAWGGWALVARTGGPIEETWLWAAHVGGGALLLHHLLSPGLAPTSSDNLLWASRSPLAANLRLAVVATAVAVPTLVAYASVEPGRFASLAPAAFAIAAALGVGTVLVVMGRVLGAIAVVVGGVGLTLLCAALFALATQPFNRTIATTYTSLWAPAAAIALALGIELAAAFITAWRADSDGAIS